MSSSPTHVLILGAYGLIGSGITRHLLSKGYRVTGLGRDRSTAQRVLPTLPWIIRDVATLRRATDWTSLLEGVTCVVNCSGALQDGPQDDLEAVHHHAVAALAKACAKTGKRLIQISAVGADATAPTAFMASKGRGDEAIRTSNARYNILRPGLVLAPQSYGGTALLRMLAAIPLVQPLAVPKTEIQTVSLDDVARFTEYAIDGTLPQGTELDLVEKQQHTLRQVLATTRRWLGFAAARREVALPGPLTRFIAIFADGLSYLGWRSPLRSTAIQVLQDGVTAPAPDVSRFNVAPLRSMDETFANMTATVEARLHARMLLMMPILIATLSVFWGLSGLIGLARVSQAAEVLVQAGWAPILAAASVVFWALVDIAIGIGFAFRRSAKHACWAAVAVSLIYLAAATLVTPHLWLDPLGPLLKVIPGAVLALVARACLETR